MHRFRVALAVAVLAGGFSLLGLAAPDCTYACSCVQPEPIATYGEQPEAMILTGTVAAMDPVTQRGTFHVDRWFKGSSEVSDIPILGGDGASCGIPMAVGQEMVMVAYVQDGILQSSLCAPWGDLSTPEGQALRDEAIEAFGEGTTPGDVGEAPAPGTPTSGDGGFAIPWIVVIGGGLIVIIIGVIAAASFVSGRRGG